MSQRHHIANSDKAIQINPGSHSISYDLVQFSGGERHVQLQLEPEIKLPEGATPQFQILARLRSPTDLIDLLLVGNALRHRFGENLELELELPYLPYARQDRVCAPGQAFSLEMMAGLLQTLNPSRLTTWDCHSGVGIALTGAINVSPADIVKQSPELVALLKAETSVLICPDKGAVKRCTEIVDSLGLAPMVRCAKERDPSTGEILHTRVDVEDLTGKCAVISDDICDGGFTFIKISEQLRAKNAERVVLFVTHGIFSKGLGVFDGLIDEVITTNSLPQSAESGAGGQPAFRIINVTQTNQGTR